MKKTAGIVVGSLFCVVMSSATAAADTPAAAYDVIVTTTNDSAVASVDRWAAWQLEVCDTDSDGMRAKAELRNLSTGRVLATAQDASGSADDDCGFGYAYPTPLSGQTLRVTVWVQDGAGGTPRFRDHGDFSG